jgi:AcrR family transcriptional regulator
MTDELPRVLRLLWGHDEPARPGPKPGLSIGAIAAAAVKIADADGLGAVSMAKVAAELGFTTMSLYRYVASKDDLYVVMLDEAYGPPELGDLTGLGWRERLTVWATAARDMLLQRPWILQVPISEPPLAPNQMSWMEAGLQALAGTGLTEQEKLSSMLLVDVYVRGIIQLTTYMRFANKQAGITEQEADLVYGRRLEAVIDPDQLPGVAAAFGSGSLTDGSDFATDEFGFGLGAVLDGIAALIERRTEES